MGSLHFRPKRTNGLEFYLARVKPVAGPAACSSRILVRRAAGRRLLRSPAHRVPGGDTQTAVHSHWVVISPPISDAGFAVLPPHDGAGGTAAARALEDGRLCLRRAPPQ